MNELVAKNYTGLTIEKIRNSGVVREYENGQAVNAYFLGEILYPAAVGIRIFQFNTMYPNDKLVPPAVWDQLLSVIDFDLNAGEVMIADKITGIDIISKRINVQVVRFNPETKIWIPLQSAQSRFTKSLSDLNGAVTFKRKTAFTLTITKGFSMAVSNIGIWGLQNIGSKMLTIMGKSLIQSFTKKSSFQIAAFMLRRLQTQYWLPFMKEFGSSFTTELLKERVAFHSNLSKGREPFNRFFWQAVFTSADKALSKIIQNALLSDKYIKNVQVILGIDDNEVSTITNSMRIILAKSFLESTRKFITPSSLVSTTVEVGRDIIQKKLPAGKVNIPPQAQGEEKIKLYTDAFLEAIKKNSIKGFEKEIENTVKEMYEAFK